MPEVIDAWFDSGSMPFAQWGYPHVEGSAQMLEQAYPADFICEAIDQTRGWFYTLMAVGTLVFDQSSYRNVLCLGHILAEDGRKMSKHLGNILEPIPLMDEHGADAVRWFMAAGGSPWAARRVGHTTIQETVRKVLLTYWNTVAFQVLYARTSDWSPGDPAPDLADRPALDRWALSEAHRLALAVTEALESFDTQRAGSLLSAYVDDLSNWYVRRSRRRFWAGDAAALATLHECLYVVTLTLAPLTPFITERVWRDMFASTSDELPESVHLAQWPRVDGEPGRRRPDGADEARPSAGRAGPGRAGRRQGEDASAAPAGAGRHRRRTTGSPRSCARRWPTSSTSAGIEPLSSAGSDLVDHTAKGNFRALGKRFAKDTPRVAAAIAAADAGALADALKADGKATVELDGEPVEVLPDEVIVSERPREGWSVVNEQGETVALDLELTPELRRAGLAREVVRMIQEARKTGGFEVSDRIALSWHVLDQEGSDETREAIEEHRELIAREVLASTIAEADTADGLEQSDPTLGLAFTVYRI